MRIPVLLLLTACSRIPGSVAMTGTLFQDASAEAALAGGALSVRDVYGDPYSEATAESDGQFSVDVPAGAFFTLVITGSDAVPTSFSGTASTGDFEVEDGTFWAMGEAELAEQREAWAGCPDADGGGAIGMGEVRLYVPGNDPVDLPTVTTAVVSARGSDEVYWTSACYRDDSGIYDEEATTTGDTGAFALFGLPPGLVTLRLYYTAGLTESDTYTWRFYVPEGGVAPLYPAWVDLI